MVSTLLYCGFRAGASTARLALPSLGGNPTVNSSSSLYVVNVRLVQPIQNEETRRVAKERNLCFTFQEAVSTVIYCCQRKISRRISGMTRTFSDFSGTAFPSNFQARYEFPSLSLVSSFRPPHKHSHWESTCHRRGHAGRLWCSRHSRNSVAEKRLIDLKFSQTTTVEAC